MIFITRRERFSAAHRLFRNDWSNEKNYEVYGACSNPNWHGHNYILWVTVKGKVDPDIGYLCDLKTLSYIIKKHVISKLDHKNLNTEVEFMKNMMVSTENLATAIWQQLQQPVTDLGVDLHSVKVQETENNYAEYFGN